MGKLKDLINYFNPKFRLRNYIENYVLPFQKTYIQAAAIHPQIFTPYKNKYKNKEVVIVGCGPSLKYYKPLQDAIHIGVNRAFLFNEVQLDYLFLQDYLKGGNNMQLANEYNPETCTKFYGIQPINTLKHSKFEAQRISQQDILNANAKTFILEDWGCFSWHKCIEFEPFADYFGAICSALQFALYTNPKRIYLVGCDCSDQGHFHEECPDFKYRNTKDLTWQKQGWTTFKQYLEEINCQTEFISINPVGLKGLFKDIYTDNFPDKI